MKRGLPLLGAVGLALALTGCATSAMIMVDYPFYASAQDLYSTATTVIVGTVRQTSGRMIDDTIQPTSNDPTLNPQAGAPGQNPAPQANPYTVHEVLVTKAIKGGAQVGDVIEVGEVGGRVGRVDYKTSVGILMSNANTYLLFLSCTPGYPCDLMSPVQSVYPVAADGTLTKLAGNQLSVDDVATVAGL